MDLLKHKISNSIDHPKEKRRKPGIIYLSTIPPGMNILALREYFSKFGQIDRVFLQPVHNKSITKGKKMQFSEGWVEFKSKKKAKHAEAVLNNQPVGGKKSNPYYDVLWNIKYITRFKWVFLNQRLEYEKLAFRKRMAAEISQVNKETDHYLKASIKGDKLKKAMGKEGGEGKKGDWKSREGKIGYVFKQKLTDEEIQKKKEEKIKKKKKYTNAIEKRKKRKQKSKENKANKTDDFVASIFVGSTK